MSHPIAALIARKISEGLSRKSITRCSEWALKYRIMGQPFPGKWTFDHHPWLREMHDSDAQMNIGQKSAQMGYTETVLNWVLFNIDIRAVDALYLLPSWKPDATDFSSGRFGMALEMSQHLQELFNDVANVGHKRAGTANLYIRGSHSRSQLKSIPVSLLTIDERDEMDQAAIPLAFERQSGQVFKQTWQISTPTYPNYGINADFLNSSQNHFFFTCPCCSRFTELVFPDCLVVTAEKLTDPTLKDSWIKCIECGGKLPHETKRSWLRKGVWVEGFEQRDDKGWYINQLYSPEVKPWEIATTGIKGQTNPAEETEFYNSKGGLPHTVKGAGVTEEDLMNCYSDYRMFHNYNGNRVVTMGVDVGYPELHIEIDEWILPPPGTPVVDINQFAKCRMLKAITVPDFADAIDLFQSFRVNFCVVDAQPERRQALSFANKLYGRVRLCTYEQGITGKSILLDTTEPRIKVDRTSWLDLSLGRFKAATIRLPGDTPLDYKQHIKNQVRVYEKDRSGNPTGRYITPSGEDHFGHARNYSEIALPLACANQSPINIESSVF
jgi:hypothetical protein